MHDSAEGLETHLAAQRLNAYKKLESGLDTLLASRFEFPMSNAPEKKDAVVAAQQEEMLF